MPRKGENIYKRKDGRWEGRYIKSHSGTKALYGYIYGKSYREVRDKLVLAKIEIQQAQNCTNESNLILSVCAKQWLTEKESTVKYSTYMKYTNMLNSYILPYLGEELTNNLGYDEISDFCTALLQEGGADKAGLSPKITSDCLTLVKSIIKYASRKRCRVDTSAYDVSIKLKSTQLRVLTRHEQELLLMYLKHNPTPINTGIMISLFTGIRLGELCALKWQDISIENKSISIVKTLQRIQTPNGLTKTSITITEPKSECSKRLIPIPDVLLEYLTLDLDASFYVLTNDINFVEPRTVQNHFKSAIASCGILDANFHSLRHTFATRCIEVGFDIKSLSEILGHANVSITLNRYVHPSMELKKKNMDKLSSLFSVN